MKDFSIIVPVYNVEPFLPKALDSLIHQPWDSCEFLLVNDGSTDGSGRILKEYCNKDSRFKLAEQPNRGYGAAMNRGLDMSRGRYIGILEPDDFYEENCLILMDSIIKDFNDHPPEIIKANFNLYFDSPGSISPYPLRSSFHEALCSLKTNPELIINNPSIWSAFYQRDFLEKNQIRFQETAGASFQDLDFFWQTMTRAERIYVADHIIYNYRQDNPDSSIKKNNDPFRIIRIYEKILPGLTKNPWVYSKVAEDIYWNYRRIASKDRREYRKKASKLIKTVRTDDSQFSSRKVKWFMRWLGL